ncbi:unnamed protein product [Effrenium voratum]|nr:unnamed protein product [Effrenium voratum]
MGCSPRTSPCSTRSRRQLFSRMPLSETGAPLRRTARKWPRRHTSTASTCLATG